MENIYKLLEEKETDFYKVMIIEGEFDGIVYAYGTVSVSEPSTINDTCRLSFTHEVFDNPDRVDIINNKKFEKLIGDILIDIIDKA